MAELSPAAKAVLDAAMRAHFAECYSRQVAAYTLRAAADQLLAVEYNGQMPADIVQQPGINWARDALHALASELEGVQAAT
jgi:hypothetical protein